jgi:RNA polymerase sigma factor (sigma-70 family)
MDAVNLYNHSLIAKVYKENLEGVLAVFRQAGIASQDCEDLAQDVFLKLMEQTYLNSTTLKGLVFSAAYHLRIDYFRRKQFAHRHLAPVAVEQCPSAYRNEGQMEAQEVANMERKAVACLQPLDARIYELSRFEGKKADEIAMQLNLGKRALENRLYRSKAYVRQSVRQAMSM